MLKLFAQQKRLSPGTPATLTCIALLALGPLPASANSGAPAPKSPPLLRPQGPLELSCWQDGEKIIQETGLRALSLSGEFSEKTLSFTRDEGAEPRLLVLNMGRSLCLVKSSEK